jgi:hypothetical protein
VKETYKLGDAMSIAQITAFMYAGAIQSQHNGLDFEHWEGHTGFTFYCAEYAVAIDEWLDTRTEDDHPGVMLYELIEPMGRWLIQLDAPIETDAALKYFKEMYLVWID